MSPHEVIKRRLWRQGWDVPTLVVVGLAAGLWGLWPRRASQTPRREVRRPPTVTYGRVREHPVMSPMLFARSAGLGFDPPQREPSMHRVAAAPGEAVPRWRTEPLPEPPPQRSAAEATDDGWTAWPVRPYRPMRSRPEAAAAETSVETRWNIRVGRSLAARGFGGAPPPATPAADGFPSWYIEAYIEIDAAGVPRAVMLERASGDPEVDGEVVRTLWRWRAAAGDRGVFGRVWLSYGRR